MAGASTARPVNVRWHHAKQAHQPTLVLLVAYVVDAGTSHQDIVHNTEDALTTNPKSISSLDPGVVEDSSLVHFHTAMMDVPSERYFVRMEVIEARSTNDFLGMVAQDVNN